MTTARQLIDDLNNETGEGTVSPQRLAGIYDAILNDSDTRFQDLQKQIDEKGSGDQQIPDDLTEKLKAIGTTAANAQQDASTALSASSQAAAAAEDAKKSAASADLKAAQAEAKATDALTASDAAVTAAQANADEIEKLRSKIPSIWTGTASQYDAIAAKDSETLYFITE